MRIENLLMTKATWAIGAMNSDNRHQWVADKISKIPDGESILDAGAGEMPFLKYCSHLKYSSQDFCQYDGVGNSKGLQTCSFQTSKIDIVSDITNIPVPDNFFDNVLCTEVLEHTRDPVSVVKELIRVLKPSGRLIITTPFCSLTHFAPYHFYSGFNKYFFQSFSDCLQIEELSANGNFYEFLAQEINRLSFIANRYDKVKINFWGRLLSVAFLRLLSKCNKSNHSSELLCFGFHLYALKNG